MRSAVARLVGMALGLLVLASLVVAGDRVALPPGGLDPVADMSQFNPGNIISNSVFFDGGAMSAAEVQAFIEYKGLNCRTGGDGTPCLKTFRQDTTARAADAYCSGYAPAAQETAGAIVAKVAASCDINPRVLLVMLQKEQGLVTSTGGTGLTAVRYQKAMGFACPDTAPCDAAYYGFQNQVYSAARQFQRYAASPTSFGYRAGRTNNVLFHPNSACGSSPVYIQNQATAGLYVYTPYQPNARALAAGYGTGDSCSSYGNRNFWLYFTDWFGSTHQPGESGLPPLGHLDSVTAVTGDRITLSGWAVDPDTPDMIPVHVYVDGTLRGEFPANEPRPDIAALLPAYGERHGFAVPLSVSRGRHQVCAYGINVGSPTANTWLGCRDVDTGSLPLGNIETAVVDEGQGLLTGWALDGDSTAPIDVHTYVNGALAAYRPADGPRPDVAAAYPGNGSAHGFTMRVPLVPGANEVCVYAINVPAPAHNPVLGCRVLTLQVDPVGSLEEVEAGPRSVTVTGWAFDPETRSPIDVHVLVDGVDVAAETADEERRDVPAHFPAAGPRHGYSFAVPVEPGDHEVCVVAMNVRQGGTNPTLGCRTVNVGLPPIGNVEQVTVSAFSARLVGWTLDPDTATPIDLHVYVDGRFATSATASAERPDVGAAYPGAGSVHGYDLRIPAAAGRHSVCVYGINVLGGQGNPSLGCRTVDVAPGQSLPFGQLEGVTVDGGITRVSGWVVEPDAPTAPVAVHFYVDGRLAGYLDAAEDRPDVAAAFPGAGPAHGYTGSLVLAPGPHTVCTYGINQGAPGINPILGCRRFTVP